MKFIGPKSLSAWMVKILKVGWVGTLVFAILTTLAGIGLVFFVSLGQNLQNDPTLHTITIFGHPVGQELSSKDRSELAQFKTEYDRTVATIKDQSNLKARRDFEKYLALPLAVKLLMFPYFWALMFLLLNMLKDARRVFENFRENKLFDKANVTHLTRLNKFNVAFSIMTLSFSALVTSFFLWMLCEIFRNGVRLQEEHDLTV